MTANGRITSLALGATPMGAPASVSRPASPARAAGATAA